MPGQAHEGVEKFAIRRCVVGAAVLAPLFAAVGTDSDRAMAAFGKEPVHDDPVARRRLPLSPASVVGTPAALVVRGHPGRRVDWQPVKEFTFTSAKGRSIHNLVVLPPAFDPAKKYPLFVVIHGGPASQWMDQFVIRWNYHLLASPGYVVLLTNFTGSTGFGEAFAQAIQGDPLDTPGQEILQGVDEALARYPFIDGSRMAAGGASYGGHLTNWLAVTTTRFKALVSHAGLYDQVSQWTTSDIVWPREVTMGGPAWEKPPLWQSQNPIMKSDSLKTPMLVTAGERDYRVPVNNTLQLWSILQRQRVPSRLIVFPDENHWVLKGENSRYFYDEVHAWLAKWLKAP